MRIETTFVQNTPASDPDLAYLNKARFILEIANGHGVDGVGILNAEIRNRHLWLTLTSGAEINAGAIFTEEELPIASNLRPGIAAFNPEFFNISAGKVSLRTDLNFGLNITELSQYLTENKYATQEWIKAQGYIGKDGLAQYATKNWILEQDYIKASSLDQYLPKNIWDAVFEVAEVDGKQVLKIKHEVIGNLGITAYGTEPDADTGSADALVDLVDVAVSRLKSGDILKYNGTHFVNVPIASIAGASSWEQISGKPEYFPTQWSEINDAPTSLPAADVYPWAKAATKPAYTWDEITDKPSVFTPDSHTHLWANITDRPTSLPANGGNADTVDNLHASDLVAIAGEQTITGHKIFKEPLTYTFNHEDDGSITILNIYTGGYKGNIFIGSNNSVSGNTLIRVAPNGSFIYKYNNVEHQVFHSGNFTPSNKLDKSVWDEAFEIKTVNGIRVISAKLDVLGQKGISAYADSADAGSAGGGLDYELLKNALTGTITPDGYPFTISSMFLGAIDKSYITGKIGDLYADSVHTHKWTDITDRPTSLPANGGNADTVDGLHSYDFARRSEFIAGTDLNSINGFGLFQTSTNSIATSEKHYPISEAGILIYGNAAYNSSCQIYGSYNSNRWFVRGGGTSAGKTSWSEIWTTKNFDPNDYLPLSGGKTITGDFSVSAGVKIKSNEANIIGRFVFGSITDYRTIVGAFDYDTLLISKSALKRNTNGTEYTIYDSGNLTKLSQLQDDVVSGNYFKLSANRVSNLNDTPINSFFVSALGPSYSPVSYASFVNGFCFAADNNSSYKRQLVYADDWYGRTQNVGTWGGWYKFWHSGNFLPNYKFDNFGVTLDSKNEVGNGYTLIEAGASFSGPFLKWGQPDWMFEFYSPNDISNVYLRNMFDGAWQNPVKLWHSGNLNPVTIDSDQIITGWKRFTPKTKNGVYNTSGKVGTKDTYGTPFSWNVNSGGSIWNVQQESDLVTLIGVQNGRAIKLHSGLSESQITADKFNGIATKAQQDGNGNVIANSYLRLTGGTLTGNLTTQNITANGTVTAPTFVGKLSGASSLLNINNDAGQSSVLQFMQMSTQNEANDLPSNTWHHVLKMNHGNGDTYFSRSLAFSFFDNGIYTRYRSNGTAHEWVALYGGHNANRSDVDWTARNINASETGTFKRLVINGIVIEVVNGNLRINGNLVATGGVTSQATA